MNAEWPILVRVTLPMVHHHTELLIRIKQDLDDYRQFHHLVICIVKTKLIWGISERTGETTGHG